MPGEPTQQALEEAAIRLARMAREEDFGDRGDITGQLIDDVPDAEFRLVFKQRGVFAGRAVAGDVVGVFDPGIRVEWAEAGQDGRVIEHPPACLATLRGSLRSILAAERTLLNFLQHLSGTATLTRRFVDAVAETSARILDTRKTAPGWRLLDKYAVRCGGGHNHRTGLYDAVLIKDNHLAPVPPERIAQAVFDMLNGVDRLEPRPTFVEVEADNLAQVEPLLSVVGIDVILLDNFSVAEVAAAVELRRNLGLAGRIEFEVSGGVTLETARAFAETGVERISVGAITHSAPAVDVSLDRT